MKEKFASFVRDHRGAIRGAVAALGAAAGQIVARADAPTVTDYTGFVADVTSAVTGAIPTMLTAVAPVVAGLLIVGIGIALVRRFAH